MIYQRNTLQMTEGQNGTYAFLGAWKILFGGVIGKTIIKIFGCAQLAALLPALSTSKRELLSRLGGMTTFSNVANAVAQGLGAVASSANYMYSPLL